MAKQKKKRNKQYRGIDARSSTPQVIHVSAEERTPLQEWWKQYGKIIRVLAIGLAVIAAIVITIIGLFGIGR